MAANPTEVRIQRRLILAHIKAKPVELILFRPVIEKTPAGGLKKGAGTPQPKILGRLIPFKNKLTAFTRDTPDGNIINLAYVLVSSWDADIKPGDYFQHEMAWYDVLSIEPDRSYRTAANITYRGEQIDDTWGK